ncbi:MAG TPA: hypothetical protein VNS50_04345 [Ginsengibacter sp.]|nr:hypothetical protein [Ginsengibacter sp.]
MHSIIIALMLVTIVTILCLALVSVNNRQRKKIANDLVSRFYKLGKENNLIFTQMDVLGYFIIGLDDVYNKIMVLTKSENKYDSVVIDLNEAKSCSKRNIYKRINIGTAKRDEFESYVDEIFLVFDFQEKAKQINLCFYDSGKNSLLEMSVLEQKAKDWDTRVTRAIRELQRKRA